MRAFLAAFSLVAVLPTQAQQRLIVNHPGAGLDATSAIQQALDSTAAEVVIQDMEQEWITGPLRVNRDDLRLTLAPGVTLRGKENGFPGKEDALLSVEKRKGFTLIAHGATLVMPGHEFTEGEHRHCLNLRSVSKVRVHGGRYERSGGDGIYLGTRDGRHLNDDIVITDVLSVANRRQGMSVTCASNLVIQDCIFIDTKGTPPEAGLDLEPNSEKDHFTNCTVSHCLAINNAAQGFENHFNRMRATSQPIDILYDHCYAEGGLKYGITILAADAKHAPPLGQLTVRNCVTRVNGTAGIRTRNGGTDGLRAMVENSYILHPGTLDKRAPLWLLAQDGSIAPHGDAEFSGLHVVDGESRPAVAVSLQGSAANQGLGEFSGQIHVLSAALVDPSDRVEALLPDLKVTHEVVTPWKLAITAPSPTQQVKRGQAVDLKLALPAAEVGTLRMEVRHGGKVIHQSESPISSPPAVWQSDSTAAVGVYSIWFTLLDAQLRVHDIAATAVTLLP
jgi:hypothetical protein